ncbi:hypothetical protein UFOVP16_27 [uncultured Caudovirales phage]|uniref:Uncharacterized protein n=1 Tax=uncultured Caudovirales phage TaxID=2100421 RepID=A0A6J5KII4_9CAUD|nr:hypothetical protein UFOVP16_27 [uncultured Caudovirales phage]
MRMTDISIKRSAFMVGSWMMEITVMTPQGEMKSTQHFEDFGGFLLAVKEVGTFFAVRLGKISAEKAGLTRAIAPNRDAH